MAESPSIIALGPRDEMAGLASIGVSVVPVEGASELDETLRETWHREGVQVILVSETIARDARELIAEHRVPRRPIVLVVPSHRGSEGSALSWMKHGMEQQIGVDMISQK